MKKAYSFEVKPAVEGLLSVIVPVYSCTTVVRDLKSIERFLKKLNRPYEIICVLDGLKDSKDKTHQKALPLKSKTIRVVGYKKNRGKGYAVRYGMARAKGDIIAFIDAGSDLNASGIGMALEHMKWYDADIVIGSKRHPASKVNYPWKRKILSFLVQRSVRILLGLNVSDTQTGLKIFRREVLEMVLPRLLVKRWAFDLEILAVANRLGFTKIYESPIELNFNFSSTITRKTMFKSGIDYLAIIYRVRWLKYYDDVSKDIWEYDKRLRLRYKLMSKPKTRKKKK